MARANAPGVTLPGQPQPARQRLQPIVSQLSRPVDQSGIIVVSDARLKVVRDYGHGPLPNVTPGYGDGEQGEGDTKGERGEEGVGNGTKLLTGEQG